MVVVTSTVGISTVVVASTNAYGCHIISKMARDHKDDVLFTYVSSAASCAEEILAASAMRPKANQVALRAPSLLLDSIFLM